MILNRTEPNASSIRVGGFQNGSRPTFYNAPRVFIEHGDQRVEMSPETARLVARRLITFAKALGA